MTAMYRSCVIASASANRLAAFLSCAFSVIDMRLMRAFAPLLSFIFNHLQALVTTVAVKLRLIGILHMLGLAGAF